MYLTWCHEKLQIVQHFIIDSVTSAWYFMFLVLIESWYRMFIVQNHVDILFASIWSLKIYCLHSTVVLLYWQGLAMWNVGKSLDVQKSCRMKIFTCWNMYSDNIQLYISRQHFHVSNYIWRSHLQVVSVFLLFIVVGLQLNKPLM